MKSLSIASVAVAAAALSAVAVPSIALAAESSVAFNAGVVTDYRYRGISQSRLQPALQGGVDFTAGAFYLGAWASTIKWIKDSSGDANVEIDLYGGYKGEISKGVTYDIGALAYQYPSNKLKPSANTFEIYGAITAGPVTAKYSRSTTNLFGFADSKGSGYLDISATFDVGGFAVTPHIGRQTLKNNGPYSYTDYSLTASKAFGDLTVSAGVIGMNGDKALYVTPAGKFTGKTAVVAGIKYSF
jgi:uncharacterized protein (TIGR02001 family)